MGGSAAHSFSFFLYSIFMKKILLLSFAALLLWNCDKKNNSSDDDDPTGKVPFVQANWDGEKRGDVFYEIFVRSFADSNNDKYGDLKGVADKLDYLHELGINGIWMMPIHPSPSYHGYDVEDYKGINPQYGTMADFDVMMAKANQLGIKVILDLVVNHTSKTHPWFKKACSSKDSPYRNFFLFAPRDSVQFYIANNKVPSVETYDANEWHNVESGTTNYKYYGAFSSWMPDINPESTAAMDSIYDAAQFWIDKGVYGFRLDAIKHMYQKERSQKNINFWKAFYAHLKVMKPDVYLIGEVLSEADLVAIYYRALDHLFNFSSWWRLDWAINAGTGKYYANDIQTYLTQFKASNVNYVNTPKLANHDEDRTMSILKNNWSKAKLAAVVMLTQPGQPYMYYGEEIGMRNLKNGDDANVREPFLWTTKASDTYRAKWRVSSTNIDANVPPLSLQQDDETSLYNVYVALLKLRNTYPALAEGDFTYVFPSALPDALSIYTRQKDEQRVMIIHNFSATEMEYEITNPLKNPIAGFGGAYLKKDSTQYFAILPAYSSLFIELK